MRTFSAAACLFLFAISPEGPLRAEGFPVYVAVGGSVTQTEGFADTDNRVQGASPSELPLGGLPFDDESSGWSVDVGYRFADFFAVEIGYRKVGSFETPPPVFGFSAAPPAIPSPPGPGFIGPLPVTGVFRAVALPPAAEIEADSFNIATRFGVPLSDRFRALWHLGLARSEFEAGGSTSFLSYEADTGSFTSVSVPYRDPDDETGYFFGFGIGWRLNDHFDTELSYSRQDLRVLEFDSIVLRFVGRL